MVAILIFLGFVFLSFSIGRLFLKLFRVHDCERSEEIILSIGLGIGLIAFFIYLLGLFSIFFAKLFLLAILVALPCSYKEIYSLFKYFKSKLLDLGRMDRKELVLIAALFFLMAFNVLSALAPISSMDALTAHFAFPKIYMQKGYITPLPDYWYSYFPTIMQMINLLALFTSFDIVGALSHLFFGVLTAWLLYLILRQRLDRKWGLIGAIAFYSSGIITWESVSSYIDLSISFYIFAFFFCWAKHLKHNSKRYLLLSSVFLGFAIFSKIIALSFYAIFVLWLFWLLLLEKKWKHMGWLFLSFVVALVPIFINLPWLIKNYVQVRNPLFPYFGFIFSVDKTIFFQDSNAYSLLGTYGIGKNLTSLLITPLWIFIKGDIYDYGNLLGPVVMSFMPLCLLALKDPLRRRAFFLLLLYYLSWFYMSQQARFLLPAFAICIFIVTEAIEFVSGKNRILYKFILTVLIVGILFNMAVSTFYNIRYLPVVTGVIDKDQFLSDKTFTYYDIKWMNENLDKDKGVLVFSRGMYYLDNPYINGNYFLHQLKKSINGEYNVQDFLALLKKMNLRYVYVFGGTGDEVFDSLLRINTGKRLKLIHKTEGKVRYKRWAMRSKPFAIDTMVYEVVN